MLKLLLQVYTGPDLVNAIAQLLNEVTASDLEPIDLQFLNYQEDHLGRYGY